MGKSYEECRSALQALLTSSAATTADRNEAATRLQLINTLLFDCLGWSTTDCQPEDALGGEYADYVLSTSHRVFIVEAKREGFTFQLPPGKDNLYYSLSSLVRDFPDLKSALKQVAGYCQQRGVPLGAVCNGHQIVAFIANRTDGVPPLEGKAIVFPSLQYMLLQFAFFWKAMSKPGIEARWLQKELVGDLAPELPPKLSAKLLGYPGVKGRNVFQTELQILTELVLEDIARAPEMKEQFLRHCYCQSGALSQYALTAKNILSARYAALFDSASPGPTVVPATNKHGVSPDILAESLSRRPILLLGDVGVGKTTFIDYLTVIEAANIFDNAIAVYIDLGSQATLTHDLREFVVSEVATQLREKYAIDIFDRQFINGVYNLDLQRFEKGIYGALRELDPPRFLDKQLEFLNAKLAKADEHVAAALNHIVKGRNRQVVIFVDNADQRIERDYEVQQQAFLIAQEIAQHWPAMIFVALRPETFHRSARSGALSGYHAKALSIAPPRIDLVIEKRLDYARKLTVGEIALPSLQNAGSQTIQDLGRILTIFRRSMDRNKDLPTCIDNIAGGNVRLALDLVRGFFGSGHVDTLRMVQIEAGGEEYIIPIHQFLRAVIFGDSQYYSPDRSPIANLFDLTTVDPREHFLLPLLIVLLRTTTPNAVGDAGFVETHRVFERLQSVGFNPEQIDSAILRAHRAKLLETAARRIPGAGEMPSALRPTTVGLYHVFELASQFSYMDAIIVDTPVLNESVRQRIHDVDSIRDRLARCGLFLDYLDECWDPLKTCGVGWDWSSVSNSLASQIKQIGERIDYWRDRGEASNWGVRW